MLLNSIKVSWVYNFRLIIEKIFVQILFQTVSFFSVIVAYQWQKTFCQDMKQIITKILSHIQKEM